MSSFATGVSQLFLFIFFFFSPFSTHDQRESQSLQSINKSISTFSRLQIPFRSVNLIIQVTLDYEPINSHCTTSPRLIDLCWEMDFITMYSSKWLASQISCCSLAKQPFNRPITEPITTLTFQPQPRPQARYFSQ